MAKILILGAGFAGQTAALYLGAALGRDHEITLVNRSGRFLYIPSLVWVGTARMAPEKTQFELGPVCKRMGVNFVHGLATEVNPDEGYALVLPKSETGEDASTPRRLDYDYLVVATGPQLNFAGTEGLGPAAGNSWSICTLGHAVQCRDSYLESVARMEQGEKQRLVIGTGHPGATCQGAAFEYITNIHKDLVRRRLRDRAELVWLSNERAAGDFGVRGVQVRHKGKTSSSEDFIGAVFRDFGIECQVRRGVKAVGPGVAQWEDFDGVDGETRFDFAMLIPQFTGVPIAWRGEGGKDVSEDVVNPGGFVKVDGIYGLPWDQLAETPDAWPGYYQNRRYRNLFAAGIAFAPPGPISQPHVTPRGTVMAAAPPRTGMVSGIIGRVVARNIVDLVRRGRMGHHERMSEMYAACIASMGDSLWDGGAATIMIYPVVPDPRRFPAEGGRDLFVTHMEMGLAGAWMKRLIHSTFIHKLQGRPGWKLIPE
ncbi:MAG: FAD-dependent oxidoreductase [Candidatus Krumholzibacteriia bacterium]